MGGRGSNSPNGPNSPLRGLESAEIRSPAFQRRAPTARRFARRLRRSDLQYGGTEFLQIPSCGEIRLA
eukprot:2191304-Alexandrium_andersonii.AAC.1